MTVNTQSTSWNEVLELLSQQGFDGLGQAVTTIINASMLAEREKFIGAERYQRTAERRDHANGFKPKAVKTRLGELQLDVPQTRGGGFYPSCLEKGIRSERALTLALAEMYVQGVATRRVADIVEKMCGFEVSAEMVSHAAAELDPVIAAWRKRAIARTPYLFLDALYIKVREGGLVRDMAMLVALGIGGDGKRSVLGTMIGTSEADVNWRAFLKSLVDRGMHGVEMVISDDHAGLGAARKAVLPSVPWQRCQVHLQRNAAKLVTRLESRGEVARDIRAVFNARDEAEASTLLDQAVKKYAKPFPRLSTWMETNIREGLTVFRLPQELRKRLRTSNVIERLNEELRRRVKVVSSFPSAMSCERLVTAVAMEISDEWEVDKRYVTIGQ